MNVNATLYSGFINKSLRVGFHYKFEPSGEYQTVSQKNGNISIRPSFGISISEGFEKPNIFIPSNKYYPLSSLLKKSLRKISDNLYEIFPDINKIEFEIDSKTLERFQTEKAMSTADMTIYPAVWVDETSSCYPAIRITTTKGNVVVPLEDAMAISEMFKAFEPMSYGLSILRIIGKVD